jgi:hypothetical protein
MDESKRERFLEWYHKNKKKINDLFKEKDKLSYYMQNHFQVENIDSFIENELKEF